VEAATLIEDLSKRNHALQNDNIILMSRIAELEADFESKLQNTKIEPVVQPAPKITDMKV
jgi:hypothetical protein